MLRKSNNF